MSFISASEISTSKQAALGVGYRRHDKRPGMQFSSREAYATYIDLPDQKLWRESRAAEVDDLKQRLAARCYLVLRQNNKIHLRDFAVGVQLNDVHVPVAGFERQPPGIIDPSLIPTLPCGERIS